MAVVNQLPHGGVNLAQITMNKTAGFWNNTDNQSQAEYKYYEYDLAEKTTYLLAVVSASTGNHSSTFEVLSGTVQTLYNNNEGNGLRVAMLYAETAARIKVTIRAKSSGARNATGLYLGIVTK